MLREVLFSLVALGSPAGNFCQPARELALSAEICQFNDRFARESEACLAKFDALAAKTATAMAGQLSQGDGTAQTGQSAASGEDFGLSGRSLESLIAINVQATRELEAYLDQLVHPLDDTNSLQVPCYSENFHAVSESIARMKEKLAQLESARTTASVKGNTAKTRAASLGAIGTAQTAHGTAHDSTQPRSARPQNRESKVTGQTPPTP